MNVWFALAVSGALIAAIGYFAFCAAKSPLLPLYIPPTAWRLALNCWRTNRRVLAGLTALVVFSAALQFYFVNAPGQDARTLLIASILWQAVMAALTAALAVPLHLYVIHGYWRLPVVDSRQRGWNLTSLLLRAAAYGLAIWTFNYVAGIATRALPLSSDLWLGRAEYFALTLASFLVTSLLVLVRPSLSLGLRHPLRTGIAMAARNPLPLYLVLAVLGIPPIVLGPEALHMPAMLIRSALAAHLVSIGLIAALNIFQYLTVEIATVLFALGAFLRVRDDAGRSAEVRVTDAPLPAAR